MLQRNFAALRTGILFRALLEGKAGSDEETVLLKSAISVDINHVVGLCLHSVAIRRWEIDDTHVESHRTILLGNHPMLVVLLTRHCDHLTHCGIRSCEGRKTTASARSRTRSCVRT